MLTRYKVNFHFYNVNRCIRSYPPILSTHIPWASTALYATRKRKKSLIKLDICLRLSSESYPKIVDKSPIDLLWILFSNIIETNNIIISYSRVSQNQYLVKNSNVCLLSWQQILYYSVYYTGSVGGGGGGEYQLCALAWTKLPAATLVVWFTRDRAVDFTSVVVRYSFISNLWIEYVKRVKWLMSAMCFSKYGATYIFCI